MEQHNWIEVFSYKIKNDLKQFINTSFPAEIVSVKDLGSKQFVDVKPLIHPEDEDGSVLDTPVIYNVPVLFQSAGGGLLSFPIKVGDAMLIVISQRAISQWLIGDGSPVSSIDIDNFEITDALAIPGLYTTSTNLKPNTIDVELKFAGNSVRLTPAGDIFADAPNNVTVTAGNNIAASASNAITAQAGSSATITAPTITLNGNVTINGSVNLNGNTTTSGNVSVGGNLAVSGTSTNAGVNVGSNHTHTGVDSGSGTSGPPT